YFTDSVYITGVYSTRTNNFDYKNTLATAASVRNNQAYIGNLIWDVNPAVRFGLEYSRYITGYGHNSLGVADTNWANGGAANSAVGGGGKADNIRFAAWYFF
ncbi:MAG TPA: hypothetical protein PLL73_09770, partial [Syntrophorhabdaceae bacterium]|nr:hypothetical protein [Syntrophorhabdaceae bacterium]